MKSIKTEELGRRIGEIVLFIAFKRRIYSKIPELLEMRV